MWYYISHLGGGLYSSEEPIDIDDLYCETCGDYDTELGYFETEKEAQAAYEAYWN